MGDIDDGLKPRKTVFVTVGTTCFDALVKAVDSQVVKDELFRKGYTDLLIQMGRGSYIPTKESLLCLANVSFRLSPETHSWLDKVAHGTALVGRFRPICVRSIRARIVARGGQKSLGVDYFTFSSSISDNLKSASLVISHAGSGSIFETLRLGKPLIVVVNEDLMDNHQSELAEELADRKHLLCAHPSELCETVGKMDVEWLLPYPSADATAAANLITRFLGFSD